MRLPIVSRRNSVPRGRYEQVIDQRDDARKEAAEHVCKIVELCGEVDSLRDQLATTQKRLLQVNGDDWKARYEAEKRRADHLQQRLDDATSLSDPRLDDGRHWQHTRNDKGAAL